MKYYYSYNTAIGELCIAENNGFICNICSELKCDDFQYFESELIKYTFKSLNEYFNGKRKNFDDIPIYLSGTEFQKKIWSAIRKIPYGNTVTYKLLSEHAGIQKGYRAVGHACNKNPVLILVPCHRVVGTNNNLTGFSAGINNKKYLIDLEAEYV